MSTVLITGASRGIGRAVALACAASGRYSRIILNGGHDAAALQGDAAAGGAVGGADLGALDAELPEEGVGGGVALAGVELEAEEAEPEVGA